MEQTTLRPLEAADYAVVRAFWQGIPGMGPEPVFNERGTALAKSFSAVRR